jgi:hypothetical protein
VSSCPCGRAVGEPFARTGPVVLTAIPSRRKRLSDGVLVEALVLGRVLGVRILTLRASVVLAPAEVTAPTAEVTAPTAAHRALASPPATRSPRLAPARRPSAGRRLAEAVRHIDEGAKLLAEARRNGAASERRPNR